MTDFFTSAWKVITELPAAVGWTVIGSMLAALLTAVVSAIVSVSNTRKTLEVQRLANARSASTFIADKRQKWIDDLRSDVSRYLSLSQEIAEGWRQLYWACGDKHDRHWHSDPQHVLGACESLRISFLRDNAPRDSEHHLLYMRILLRLNNGEESHMGLMTTLDELRSSMRELEAAALQGTYENKELLDKIKVTIEFAAAYAKIILKEEWQRLKREVATPSRLLSGA